MERKILSIRWDEATGTIDLAYADDQPDTLMSTRELAAQLADEAGLELVMRTRETFLWAQPAVNG